MSSHDECLLSIERHKDEIEALARGMSLPASVFSPVSLARPRFREAELGFLRLVAWLYVYYYESGFVSVRFLLGYFQTYGITRDCSGETHLDDVTALRSHHQHNLNYSSERDAETERHCRSWYRNRTGTSSPAKNTQWYAALDALLREAEEFFSDLEQVLREIEQDEFSEDICAEWSNRLTNYHRAHEFDAVISSVAKDMGRTELDIKKIRSRYIDVWRKQLEMMSEESPFEDKLRHLVEHSLLTDLADVLPINGKDIINVFDLAPGPEVAERLKVAKGIYEKTRCDKETLIRNLKDHYS